MSLFSRAPRVSVDPKKIDELLSRGVAETIIKEDLRKKLLSGERLRIKLGIDPTSPDLHIGRAVSLLKLRDFQELGHTAVLILGTFTAVIGDTSDKDAERPMLQSEVIARNVKTYKEQAGTLIDFSRAELRRNSEWLEPLRYQEIGEHADQFSVADFIARDVIKRRLDAGKRVSLREVLYPLMQGYDSVAVRADVELGGMDQKFNLLAGRTLQGKYGQRPQNIVMSPLIEGLDGRKMSSSWGNTVPLTATPSDMYGKVMSMQDAQIATYFELCTRVPMEEVEKVTQGLSDGTLHPKDAKMHLAREIVALYHGKDAALKAEKGWQETFSEGGIPSEIPEVKIERGSKYIDVLSGALGESKSEIRRLAEAGAVSDMEGEVIRDVTKEVSQSATLRIGKHRFLKIIIK